MYKLARTDKTPVTLRALIPQRQVGKIIGTHGQRHQKIESGYQVKMYFHDVGDRYGRLCSIGGSPYNVACAWRDVLELIFDYVTIESYFVYIAFLIPGELAAHLQLIPSSLGDGGCILHEISDKSKCRIVIEPKPLPNTSEHIMRVSVNTMTAHCYKMFETAVTGIAQQFRIHRYKALSPHNIYFTPGCFTRPIEESDQDDEDYICRSSTTSPLWSNTR
ncbi:hypothetical protein DM01DRAFT_1407072 [Hesseltinella vesiculosa]|uniref:K Homology domain-containing protein n=1 Tax=Hesseltinella vesiculosa TaxID=101127 RepID=A0A1X2GJ61_9FUNG|nr:hypothetical protein DM01DRAFT_1407072 [Hesseltinella vesiculosa]